MRDRQPASYEGGVGEELPKSHRFRLRTFATSFFIVACIAAQALRNLAVGYIEPSASWPAPVITAADALNLGRWSLYQLGWNAGLDGYWRMFSPVHRFDWQWVISAVDAGGGSTQLPLPNQSERSTFERTFVDFREAKLTLNFWQRPPMRAAYAESLCGLARRGGASPVAIRYEMIWRNIVAPDVALRRGDHLDTETYRSTVDEVPCR